MKIAELFVQLGFKVEGQDDLKAFETTLNSIAQAARNAALALKILSRTSVPKSLTSIKAAAARVTAPAGTTVVATTPVVVGTPPLLSPAKAPGSTAVNQGLKSLTTFVKQLVGFSSLAYILKSLISGFTNMVKTSAAASFNLDKFTRQTGVTFAEMKRWEQVAAANDVTAEEVQETLKSLQQNAVKISMGLGGTNANRWGIDPLARPENIFRRFQEVTKSMSQAQAMAVADAAGISERVAQMLLREREHPTTAQAGLALTQNQLDTTRTLGAAWNQLRVIMSSLADKITSDVAPAFTEVLGFFSHIGSFFASSDSARRISMWGPPGTSGLLLGAELKKDLVGKGVIAAVHALLPKSPVTNNVSVTIDGSGRPQETAKATTDAIRRMLSDASYGRAQPFSANIPATQ